jgi:D-alanine-D-alanine ligase
LRRFGFSCAGGRSAAWSFRVLGCRDYARVDFQVRSGGRPFILEVNPNPDFGPTAGLADGLASAGPTHAQFTVQRVERALARGRQSAGVRCGP